MKRALVLSLICVLGLAFSGLAATLSGSWDTDVTIDPQQTSFDLAIGLVSVLTVAYTVGDWTFTSVTDLDEDGWTDQDFSVAGVLGAFVLTSALDFVPAPPAFGSWNTTASVSIAGVSFGADFTLYPNDVILVLSGSGVAGDVTVDVAVTFGNLTWGTGAVAAVAGNVYVPGSEFDTPPIYPGYPGYRAPVAAVQTVSVQLAKTIGDGCDLDWAGITIDIGFPFCCADIDLALEFDCSGFVEACFSTTGISVPNMPYLSLDVDVCFEMDEKIVSITPAFDFGTIACFTVDFDTTWVDYSIQNIAIAGIGLECTISGVDFAGYTDFTGAGDYFEWYTITTSDDGCCGPFDFDLGIYFLDGGAMLFDIGLIDANMSLQIAAQFSFNMGLEINVEVGGFTEWTVGFEVTW